MKMTKVLLLAFMVLVPLAIQQTQALEAGGPVAGGPEASEGLAPQIVAILGCLDGLVEYVHEFYTALGQGKDLREFGCKVLADQPTVCLDALHFLLDLAHFDAGEILVGCGLPSLSPAYAPIPTN